MPWVRSTGHPHYPVRSARAAHHMAALGCGWMIDRDLASAPIIKLNIWMEWSNQLRARWQSQGSARTAVGPDRQTQSRIVGNPVQPRGEPRLKSLLSAVQGGTDGAQEMRPGSTQLLMSISAAVIVAIFARHFDRQPILKPCRNIHHREGVCRRTLINGRVREPRWLKARGMRSAFCGTL